MAQFTFFWKYGAAREVGEGKNVADAFTQLGYGAGAMRALDFYMPGDNQDYVYDEKTRAWVRKPGSLERAIAEEAEAAAHNTQGNHETA